MNFQIISPEIISESMMNNDEMIQQFIDLYLHQSPIDFQALKESIANANPKEISDKAHHIKPTMTYIGADNLRSLFQDIETMGKEAANLHLIQEKLNIAEREFNIMLEELKKLKK